MDFLLITSSTQHLNKNPAVTLDSSVLATSLSNLPMDDVVETVKRLYGMISPLNEMSVDDTVRFGLLEQYRKTLDDIFFSYDDFRLKGLDLSSQALRHLKEDITWLYLGIATGYKVIVKNGYSDELNPKHNKTLLCAIYRSIELLIRAILYASRSRDGAPPLAYLEINQLYKYAEYYHAHKAKISNLRRETLVNSVELLYKHFMLFNMTKRLLLADSKTNVVSIFTYLEPYAEKLDLMDGVICNKPIGRFVVDLMADKPPMPCSGEGVPLPPVMDGRTLNSAPAFNAIKKRIIKLSNDVIGFVEQDELKNLQLSIKSIADHWRR